MVAFALALSSGGAACQSRSEASATAPAQARELVEIFSWWSAPGEADALEALIAAHQATHREARIFNSANRLDGGRHSR